MAQSQWSNSCCNPFDYRNHSYKRKNLRPVAKWMCERAPSISLGCKICDNCRKKLAKLPTTPKVSSSSELESESEVYAHASESLASLNQCLGEIGETPVSKHKLQRSNYPKQKIKQITTAMKRVMLRDESSDESDDEGEIIKQLKERFHATTKKSEKVQILTILPKSWPVRKIQSEFGTSNYMARKAKDLVKEKGVLATPNPKLGHLLAPKTADLVRGFYESDDVSRIMPGKKDFVSVKQGEQRVHIQKRLILSNLREAYQLFKDRFPTETVGFSKFADLRPKHCILAGASGTHSVCVCTIHQNVKLMILSVKLSDLTAHNDIPLSTYHSCLAQMVCNPPQPGCYLGTCDLCPGTTRLRDDLLTALDDNMIDSVVFKQWVSVDRSTLETVTKPADEFVESFCEKLELLLPHSFIATQQASFYKDCKSTLQPGELLVTADFSENYSFILQGAAQGFHWNNSQATIHPFVAYYIDSGELCHLSYVVISDCLQHDTVAVHLFQKRLIAYLRRKVSSYPQKIYYFSDGAASQYKNRKNFINLCHHQEDFGVDAEWHFSATSHGKGACDGLGGTVKRLAARASLQRPYDEQIMTPRQLFEWASDSIPAVSFEYCSTEDYKREQTHLEERFQQSRTIPGTRKLHSFAPISKDRVKTRVFSSSVISKEERVTSQESELPVEQISGFVTCYYNEHWWVACVLQLHADTSEVKLTFLHPHGPSHSFRYPRVQDILIIPVSDILTTVDPRTTTGRVYTLTQKESRDASEKLKARK